MDKEERHDGIRLKTKPEIAHIRAASRSLYRVFEYARAILNPGVRASEIDRKVAKELRRFGLSSAIQGQFPGAVCLSANSVAVHGVPGDFVIENGDIVTLDISVILDGWHSDAAWTYGIGSISDSDRDMIAASWKCTMAGIKALQPGMRVGDGGFAIEETAHTGIGGTHGAGDGRDRGTSHLPPQGRGREVR